MSKDIAVRSDQDESLVVDVPNVGLGTYRTSATYIALFASLEKGRLSQIGVLLSALEAMDIKPEELVHHKNKPDAMLANARDEWLAQGEAIRNTDQPPCDHDWVHDAGGGFDYIKYCRKCFATEAYRERSK